MADTFATLVAGGRTRHQRVGQYQIIHQGSPPYNHQMHVTVSSLKKPHYSPKSQDGNTFAIFEFNSIG